MKTIWVWWKSQLLPNWKFLSRTTLIPLLGIHVQLLKILLLSDWLTHLNSITMGQRSRIPNKNYLWPFVPLIQLVPYEVKDSFKYSLTQIWMSLWMRDQTYCIITKLLGDTKLERTLAGHLKMQEVVTMWYLRLPKFDKNKRINQQKVLVFDNDNIKYNIILGTNFLSKTDIKLNYSEENMEWFNCSIPLHPSWGLNLNKFDTMERALWWRLA